MDLKRNRLPVRKHGLLNLVKHAIKSPEIKTRPFPKMALCLPPSLYSAALYDIISSLDFVQLIEAF